jgi:hypothetical protein
VDDYRGFAAACLDLAKGTADRADKTRLFLMAEAWLNLADRAARLVTGPIRGIAEHPLVRRTLGPARDAELPDAELPDAELPDAEQTIPGLFRSTEL